MTQLLARVARCGEWWAVEYDLDGETYHTQASNYSQISEMVVDSAALISNRPESDFSVRIV